MPANLNRGPALDHPGERVPPNFNESILAVTNCASPCFPSPRTGSDSYELQICNDPATIVTIVTCIESHCVGESLIKANNDLRQRCITVGITLSFTLPFPTLLTDVPHASTFTPHPENTISPNQLRPHLPTGIIAIVSSLGVLIALVLLALLVLILRRRKPQKAPNSPTVEDLRSNTETSPRTERNDQRSHNDSMNHAQSMSPRPSPSHSARPRPRNVLHELSFHPRDQGLYELALRRVPDCGYRPPPEPQLPFSEMLERELNAYGPEQGQRERQERLRQEREQGSDFFYRRPPIYERYPSPSDRVV